MDEIINRTINTAGKHAKRVIVTVVGFTALVLGITMIVLPGPAGIVVPWELAIMAGEFVRARKFPERVKSGVKGTKDSIYKKENWR